MVLPRRSRPPRRAGSVRFRWMARCRGAEVRGGAPHARLARRWILVFCQVEAAMKWRAALEAGGAVYKRTCQWIKPDGKPQYSGDRPGIGYESISASYAPGRSRWNGGGSHGVFIVNKGGDERTGHQTQKPLALMELLVRLFSDQGELILDPFAGSGSTGVAALRLGRRFAGWGMKPEYAEMARRRLAPAPRARHT